MQVATCTPLSTIKKGIPRTAFPSLNLEEDCKPLLASHSEKPLNSGHASHPAFSPL